jgi:plasmid stability protein
MAQLLIRNLSESTKTYIRRRAKRNGRSMEAEVREILVNMEHKDKTPQYGLGSEMVAMFSGSGVYLDEPIKEFRGMKMQIPNFEED